MEERKTCPFKIGDRVVFAPNQHAYGWTWPSFERMKLTPGQVGTITRISNDEYLYLDDDRGGLHWECFRGANGRADGAYRVENRSNARVAQIATGTRNQVSLSDRKSTRL